MEANLIMPNNLDLKRLEHFLVVLDCKSFGKAAKQLNMTQSGLTKSIQALEEYIGVTLFTRHSRGVNPTNFGNTLARHAALITAQSNRAKIEIEALKDGRSGTIEIGIAPSWLMGGKMSRVISQVIKNRPSLNIRIYSQVSSRQLFDRLLRGELDFVIGTEQFGGQHPECEFIKLTEDVHGIVVRSKHPILRKHKITVTDFKEFGWVMRENETFYRKYFESIYVEANEPLPQPIVETNSIPLIISTIASTNYLGAARWADVEVSGRTDIVLLDQPFRWKRNVSIMCRRNEPVSGASNAFIEAIIQNFSDNYI